MISTCELKFCGHYIHYSNTKATVKKQPFRTNALQHHPHLPSATSTPEPLSPTVVPNNNPTPSCKTFVIGLKAIPEESKACGVGCVNGLTSFLFDDCDDKSFSYIDSRRGPARRTFGSGGVSNARRAVRSRLKTL